MMVSRILGVAVVLMCVSIEAPGCVSYELEEGTQPGTRVTTPGTEARLNRVGFLTEGLERRIAVQRTGADRTATNTLQVWCVFRNRTQHPQKILARTSYFDKNRQPIDGPHHWETVFLAPKAIETYRTYSYAKDVHHYYIEVQEMP